MRILITGAAGFIGSHVADAALAAGHEVVGLDQLDAGVHAGRPGYWPDDAELITGDVRDPGAADRALDGVDAVCHHAAIVGLGLGLPDMPGYCDVNVTGTATLFAAMARRGVHRLVLASSMVVYGDGGYRCPEHGRVRPAVREHGDLACGMFEPRCPRCGTGLVAVLVTEDTPPDPRSIYAASKVAQEQLAGVWAMLTGGSVVALRYHNVYGPRMPRDTPYSGVAAIFRSALAAGRPPRVFEDGAQRRDFVHVTDAAAANLLALQAGQPGELHAYNIASGEPHTVGELAAALATACGGPPPVVTGEARPGDVRHIVASPQRARSGLGFTARIGFAAGMAGFAGAPLREPATRSGLSFPPSSRPRRPGRATGRQPVREPGRRPAAA